MLALVFDVRAWAWYTGILAGGLALVLLLHYSFFFIAEKVSKARESLVGLALLKHIKLPSRVMVILAVGMTIAAVAPMSVTGREILFHFAELAAIAAAGWLFIALAKFVSHFIERRYAAGTEDSL